MSTVDSSKDTKWLQLSLDFGDEPEEAHIYFVVKAFIDLLDRIGPDLMGKVIEDVSNWRFQANGVEYLCVPEPRSSSNKGTK